MLVTTADQKIIKNKLGVLRLAEGCVTSAKPAAETMGLRTEEEGLGLQFGWNFVEAGPDGAGARVLTRSEGYQLIRP